VRKQRILLRDIPATPVTRGPTYLAATIEEQLIIDENAALIGLDKAGDAIQRKSLS
jgi:hypothetical protein